MISRFNTLFPLWAVVFSAMAYFYPQLFSQLSYSISYLLIAIMLFMGMTLSSNDFLRVLKRPKIISLGLFLQFSIMPLCALMISKLYGLPDELTIGMILVGSVSGGTASNVITYLAGGDVALSITMTTVSTLFSVLATPLLTYVYVGQSLDVPVLDMLISIVKIVLIPVLLRVILNRFFGTLITKNEPYFASLSMLLILTIIAIVVALNHDHMNEVGLLIVSAVMLHNAIGLISGYTITSLLGYEPKVCRTVAIEVGMQNSGLAVALALKYFSPMSALPGAVFSIWHNISGALLASYWNQKKSNI
ncbi:MAG: bile acid:sodium symporter family protein [Epsilonproteobacteria bacterium]|nr:bile acid:sodium symporter family protein [Campylobacterota bacterium]